MHQHHLIPTNQIHSNHKTRSWGRPRLPKATLYFLISRLLLFALHTSTRSLLPDFPDPLLSALGSPVHQLFSTHSREIPGVSTVVPSTLNRPTPRPSHNYENIRRGQRECNQVQHGQSRVLLFRYYGKDAKISTRLRLEFRAASRQTSHVLTCSPLYSVHIHICIAGTRLEISDHRTTPGLG